MERGNEKRHSMRQAEQVASLTMFRPTYKKAFVNPHKFEKTLKDLSRESHLKRELVRHLLYYFSCLTSATEGTMPRSLFRKEMTCRFKLMDDFMLDNLYRCFDLKNRGTLRPEEYVRGMGMLLSNNLEQQAKFCFKVYDLNGDGFITREEIMAWLDSSLFRQSLVEPDEDFDEGVKELMDIVMRKLDSVDHDNKVSLEDFIQAVKKDTLLLEALSPCLPSKEAKCAFLLMISGNVHYQLRPNGQFVPGHLTPQHSATEL